jgi:hypothetical protein
MGQNGRSGFSIAPTLRSVNDGRSISGTLYGFNGALLRPLDLAPYAGRWRVAPCENAEFKASNRIAEGLWAASGMRPDRLGG